MKLKHNIQLFNLFSFFYVLDFYLPLKVVYFYHVTGSYATAASIISFVWIAQSLLEIPTGIFSDIVGRKKTIIIGSFCSVLAYTLYAAGTHYWIFLIGSLLEGARRSLFSGNNNAYLHNLLSNENKENEYNHHYGRLNSYMGIAMFIAALGSGFLIAWSITTFMWINIVPQCIAFIISLMLFDLRVEEVVNTNIYKHLKQAVNEIRTNINLRDLSLSEILGGGGLAAYEYQAAVYSAVWPTWAIGIARAIQEGGVVPSFYFAGKIIDKLGVYKVLITDLFTSTLGNIFAALSQSVFSPLLIMLSLPFYGASDTANQQILQKEFSEKQRATIASLNSLGNSISFSIVLYICGIIANIYGPFMALLSTQIFLIPSLYFKFRFLNRIKRKS
ncbi:MAG: MFS transporter [Candidatus Roizmanbacteria bacterium]|nr:MFS transporter [Candidatus Roizmanbacteria bacterium]